MPPTLLLVVADMPVPAMPDAFEPVGDGRVRTLPETAPVAVSGIPAEPLPVVDARSVFAALDAEASFAEEPDIDAPEDAFEPVPDALFDALADAISVPDIADWAACRPSAFSVSAFSEPVASILLAF